MYCGSSNRVDARFLDTARAMAACLARRKIGVVFGGGSIGLMGALADAALAEGLEVIGVIPQKLLDLELGHRGVSELVVVQTMHERKHRMAELADAFVALPGGWGTLEEIFEVTTWTQLGYHDKPVGLLNAHGFYDRLLAFLDQAAELGFIRREHRPILQASADPAELVERLETVELPRLDGAVLRGPEGP